MKWAFVMYAFLGFQDSNQIQQVISWNLPFQTMGQCIGFHNKNQIQLRQGVITHGAEVYGKTPYVKEMGCVRAEVYATTPDELPTLTERQKLFEGGPTI